MNKKIFLSLFIIVLSLVGLIDAGYLSFQRAAGIIPPCIPGFQCETVLRSPYANIGPIPLSVLGLVYYGIVFVLAVLVYLEKPLPSFLGRLRRAGASASDILRAVTIFGLFFSIYLLTLMAFIISAWCTYCLISALTCLLLFFATGWYVKEERVGQSYFLKGIVLTVGQWVYHILAKPLFFLFDPEQVHNTMVWAGSLAGANPVLRWFLSSILGFQTPATRVQCAGISFPNTVGLSAGYDYNGDLTGTLGSVGFGWHTIGTITLDPYEGNTLPRLTRFPLSKSILVNKGLKNIGARAVIQKLAGRAFEIPTGISIASTNKAFASDTEQIMDVAQCFVLFEKSNVRHVFYELNISCPNTHGGEPFTTAKRLETLLRVLDRIVSKPIFVKMPIDLPDDVFMSLLKVCDRHHIAGVILGNLTKDKTNPDVDESERAKWKTMPGNLSGKPTFQRSNRLIKMTDSAYGKRFIIVGTGGIFTAKDAEIKRQAGADLVQLITGMIYEGPQLIGQINRLHAVPDPEKHSLAHN